MVAGGRGAAEGRPRAMTCTHCEVLREEVARLAARRDEYEVMLISLRQEFRQLDAAWNAMRCRLDQAATRDMHHLETFIEAEVARQVQALQETIRVDLHTRTMKARRAIGAWRARTP
jgi:hypothetical protein